ncbi:hypothetical protein [Bacillus sp. X1(2014)]|uniref:hypothetical protein n=1 Tax=Bacillus sp. X1(2014) TaxID=1565991 RepID=UPI0011A24B7E|nr:hypothetical protein [Bacillus sp. X1(2014)]
MKPSKLFLLGILIFPWLTVPLMGKESFKRFLPSALFMCTFSMALEQYGEKKNWWRFYKGIPPLNSMSFFNYGPYMVSSLWILKWTYGKFPLYFSLNTAFHILYTGFGIDYNKRKKIAALVKMKKLPYFFILSFRAVLLYGFQFLTDLSKRSHKLN